MKKYFLAFLISLPLLAQDKPLIEDPSLLSLGVGIFNIVRNKKAANFQIECRFNHSLYKNSRMFIRPLAGVMATSNGASYYYGGIAFDFFLFYQIVFTPSFAPGIYIKGKGMDLGFPLEFRSSIELSYRLKNKSRFGSMFYHISNASLGSKNPGTECLVFFYMIPL